MDNLEISPEVIEFFDNMDMEDPSEDPVVPEANEEAEPEATETPEPTAEETDEADESVEEVPEEEPDEEVEEEELEAESEPEPEPVNQYEQQMLEQQQQMQSMQEHINQMQQWAQQQYAHQQQQAAQQQYQQEQQQESQRSNVSMEELEGGVDNDITGTFQWVAQNRPDLVPTVAAMARANEKYGDQVADQILFEYNQFDNQNRQSAMMEQMQAQQYQQNAPQETENVMQDIIVHLEDVHGETFSELKDDVSQEVINRAPEFMKHMQSRGMEVTPQAISDLITSTYFDVRDNNFKAKVHSPRKASKLKANQHVEIPNASAGSTTTSDEDAMNEILQGAKNMAIDTSGSF